jgi:uncharacterized membrane protein
MDVEMATVESAIDAERQLSSQMSTDSIQKDVPPVIVWIGPALLCALAYAMYNIFIKKGSASIHPVLGGVILQVVAAIFGTVLLGCILIQQYHVDNENSDGLYYDAAGVRWSIFAGIAVGLAEMLSFFVSSQGVQGKERDLAVCLCISSSSAPYAICIIHQQQCKRSQSSLAEVSCSDVLLVSFS